MNINYYLYKDVRIIKTGEVGMVIDTDGNEEKVLIEFSDGSRKWEYENNILEEE